MTEEKTEEKKEEGIKNEEIKEKTEEKKETVEIKKETDKKEIKKEKEKKEEKIEIPKKFKKLVDEISSMSVLDLAELVKILEKKFGVSAQAPAMISSTVPTSESAEATAGKEEKTIFNIELKKVGDKKIEVIKLVRDITEKGLKESKDLVDAAGASPQMVKENVKKEEAEEIKKKFTEAGAEIELK